MKKAANFWESRTVGPIKALHPMTKKVIEVDPQKDARISDDWDRDLTRLPGLLSWYAALRDTADTHFREAKHEEHNTFEDIYGELRERNPKVTETTVKMATKKDPRMRKAFRVRMDAEEMHQKLKSAVEVLQEKRWCLQNLVNKYRAERGTRDSL